MKRYPEFCNAVLNSDWNQDLDPAQKGKLAIALLSQEDLLEEIIAEAIVDFAYKLAQQLNSKEKSPL